MRERAYLWVVRALVPPARDNKRAADVLALEVGADAPFVDWVVVRPDTTRMANVAHVVAELATHDAAWRRWRGRRGRMPVVVDAAGQVGRGGRARGTVHL